MQILTWVMFDYFHGLNVGSAATVSDFIRIVRIFSA